MAQVTLPSFLRSISGRLGNICFRTYPSGKTGFYLLTDRKRTSPLTKEEIHARELFKQRVQYVYRVMKENPSLTRKQAWTIAKQITS